MSDAADREYAETRAPAAISRLTAARQLWIWLNIGIQSFGGGAATLYLIRRAAVEQHAWLTDEEFAHYWGICQIAPGINILGLVILIGYRVSGALGIALALIGLLLPSAAITVALTAVYASVKDQPLVQAVLRGVVPATVGLGLLLMYGMLRPLLQASRREGPASLALCVAVLMGCIALVGLAQLSVLATLWGAGAVVALAQWWRVGRQRRPR
ncbi:MAG TPA: chromate transporter [Roseiflexaceae bacterium]|nr:chromate transporter [Roseiflexaceae bacterium]